ncbi:MAG: glycosyltransferase family 4 protein [Paludibacter sp.]|nr:glycosyltransferase family 4 protein [Paludibacter sp.]
MKIIFSHPTGNANVRAAAKGLAAIGLLKRFYTTLAAFPTDFLYKLGGIRFFIEIRRRSYDPILKPFIRMYPFVEMCRIVASKAGWRKLIAHEKGRFCIDEVYKSLDKKIASELAHYSKKEVTGVYSYEDGAEFSFTEAKKNGVTCFYDLPIGYWRTARKLLKQEMELRPEWAATLTGFNDSEAKLARKDNELILADHIFVASSFTASTLKDYPGKLAPVHIIPYGFPEITKNRVYDSLNNKALKVLFVGGLSQRKGIANLFEAADVLNDRILLTVVGQKAVEDCTILNEYLSKHNWIPGLPHQEILQLMREYDVLVFPSLFEGFGLVVTEAMSQGTPVITTNRTCGADIIQHNENGWIVEPGSTEGLVKQLEAILLDTDCIKIVGEAAMETARKRPWDQYGKEMAAAILQTQQA